MSLETGSYINDLVASNPPGSDPKSQGDDHLRLLKNALKNCFAGFTGAVLVTGVDGGAANAYTLTPANAVLAYVARMIAIFSPTNANTGASTLNISGLGVQNLRAVDGTALVANDLVPGLAYAAVYTGTEFRLLYATKNYIDQKAFSTALPAQALGFLRSDGTAAAFTKKHTGYAQDEVRGADIASAATINLQTATGNLVHVTGTTAITAVTLDSGAEREVVFDGILTLTNGASLILPTGANITTAAGDCATFRGEPSGVVRVVKYQKASGNPLAAIVIPGYINGFGLSNDATTPNTTLDIAIGYAVDSTNVTPIIGGSAFTKKTSGTWVVGSGNNGMGNGLTVTANTWYHVFAIINGGNYDVYFDTSISAANKPASTTAFRYIGSFRTNSANTNIQTFKQYGQYFYWAARSDDLSGGTAATATLFTVLTPPAINCAVIGGGGGANCQFYTALGGVAGASYINQGGGTDISSGAAQIMTNTNSQIYYSVSSGAANWGTIGYINPKVAPNT